MDHKKYYIHIVILESTLFLLIVLYPCRRDHESLVHLGHSLLIEGFVFIGAGVLFSDKGNFIMQYFHNLLYHKNFSVNNDVLIVIFHAYSSFCNVVKQIVLGIYIFSVS